MDGLLVCVTLRVDFRMAREMTSHRTKKISNPSATVTHTSSDADRRALSRKVEVIILVSQSVEFLIQSVGEAIGKLSLSLGLNLRYSLCVC